MKRLRYFPYVLFGILACACLIYALCIAEEITVFELFVSRPFVGMCRTAQILPAFACLGCIKRMHVCRRLHRHQ